MGSLGLRMEKLSSFWDIFKRSRRSVLNVWFVVSLCYHVMVKVGIQMVLQTLAGLMSAGYDVRRCHTQ